MYTYNATVLKVIDGDTVQLSIDLGFRMSFKANCRLNGLNASELNSKNPDERAEAIRSKEYLEGTIPVGTALTIKSASLDKYGRPLVEIFLGDVNINDTILDKGLAKPYNP